MLYNEITPLIGRRLPGWNARTLLMIGNLVIDLCGSQIQLTRRPLIKAPSIEKERARERERAKEREGVYQHAYSQLIDI